MECVCVICRRTYTDDRSPSIVDRRRTCSPDCARILRMISRHPGNPRKAEALERWKAGETQASIAADMRVSQPTISKWCAALKDPPEE